MIHLCFHLTELGEQRNSKIISNDIGNVWLYLHTGAATGNFISHLEQVLVPSNAFVSLYHEQLLIFGYIPQVATHNVGAVMGLG
jgi:hypothetical protein